MRDRSRDGEPKRLLPRPGTVAARRAADPRAATLTLAPAYLRLKQAAAYLGVSARYFYRHVDARPLELPGRGKRRVLVWRVADLDAWVERVGTPRRRGRGP